MFLHIITELQSDSTKWENTLHKYSLDWNDIEMVLYKDFNFCPNDPDVNEFDAFKDDCIVVQQIFGYTGDRNYGGNITWLPSDDADSG